MECEPENIGMLNCDMVVPIADKLVAKYADCDLCFLPPKEVIERCQDKATTAKLLGNLAPKTYWVRDTQGAGGKGAQMCSEYLPGDNYSVEVIYNHGKFKASFMKKRLSYRVGSVDHNVTGIGTSAVSICVWDEAIHQIALDAIDRVSEGYTKHGIYGVDLKENEEGEVRVTEINPGRFMTASYAFYQLYNLPLLACQLFLGEHPASLDKYPLGYTVIRQNDCLPKLMKPNSIQYPARWL